MEPSIEFHQISFSYDNLDEDGDGEDGADKDDDTSNLPDSDLFLNLANDPTDRHNVATFS